MNMLHEDVLKMFSVRSIMTRCNSVVLNVICFSQNALFLKYVILLFCYLNAYYFRGVWLKTEL